MWVALQTIFHGRVIRVAHLLDSVIPKINGYFTNAQLVRVNVGWRPTTQDTQPLLGNMLIENLILETGTNLLKNYTEWIRAERN